MNSISSQDNSALIASSTAVMTEFYVGTPPHQMYVQRWHAVPGSHKQRQVVMVHGGSNTGTVFTTTPDGRPGWAPAFASLGWDAYVVDWPGVGRSGTRPENLSDAPADVAGALAELLRGIGPAAIIGHSLGGAISIKLAEQAPDSVLALVALAPPSGETIGTTQPPVPSNQFAGTDRDGANKRFANSALFPKASFDNFVASLVLYAPRIRNSGIGLTDDFKIDRSKAGSLWNVRVPVLVLVGEEDLTVPPVRMAEVTQAMGIPLTFLGRDWGMPGHGHFYLVERGSEAIANRVEIWLKNTIQR